MKWIVFLFIFSMNSYSNAQQLHRGMLWFNKRLDLNEIDHTKSKLEKSQLLYKSLTSIANKSQKDVKKYLLKNSLTFKAYYIDNVIYIENVSSSHLKNLLSFTGVKRFQEIKDHKKRDDKTIFIPRSETGVNIEYVKAPKVWSDFKVRGDGIVIAGQDTGVMWNHEALKSSYRGFNKKSVDHSYSWHDAINSPLDPLENPCGYDLKIPCDDHAHGTHTMGTAVGYAGKERQIGIAPKAKWIACRNMDLLIGHIPSYIECFEFFLAPYPQGKNSFVHGKVEFAPDIINNSWACSKEEGCVGDEFLYTLNVLKTAGIMNIFAAGNSGDKCESITNPAHHSNVGIRVGGYNQPYDRVFTLSSRGPSLFDGVMAPEIIAPSTFITSASNTGGYAGTFFSGTSMAAPHVAGTVALMWSANPKLKNKIDDTLAIIQKSADPYYWKQTCGGIGPMIYPNNVTGAGILNSYSAVKMALGYNK